jgi:ribose transport system substrate-binding protein
MKKHLNFLSMFLVAVMLLSLSGCGKSSNPSPGASPSGTSSKAYTFGYNNFGQGAYPLDMNEKETTYALQSVGMNIKVANNEFTVDKIITDAQNLVSSKVDGLLVWSAADTLYSSFNDLTSSSKTPFVLGDKFPLGDDTKAMLRQNPYFAGAISTQDSEAGAQLAKKALEDGHKTAIIVAAAVEDTNHDLRVAGFTKAFEEGGGKVLGVVHCANPSEAVQKSNDILTAYPNAECLYGSGGDYSMGALSAMQSKGIKMPIYGTDVDPNVIKALKAGDVIEANGAAGPYCAGIAAMLMVNYLDGHQIKDENGQIPMSNGLKFITVTKDNADEFEKYWLNGHPFTPEDYKKLLYRFNPNVTWKDYQDLLDSYNYDNRIAVLKK